MRRLIDCVAGAVFMTIGVGFLVLGVMPQRYMPSSLIHRMSGLTELESLGIAIAGELAALALMFAAFVALAGNRLSKQQ